MALDAPVRLAAGGTLFLQDVSSMGENSLQLLRAIDANDWISLVRADGLYSFPKPAQIIGCTRHPDDLRSFPQCFSGGLYDQFQIRTDLTKEFAEGPDGGLSTGEMRSMVERGRGFRERRFERHGGNYHPAPAVWSAFIDPLREEPDLGTFSDGGRSAFSSLTDRDGLSSAARRALAEVSRTVADLDESDMVQADHVEEASRFVTLEDQREIGERTLE